MCLCLPVLEVGEELYVSYGPHSNDFLFAECNSLVMFGE